MVVVGSGVLIGEEHGFCGFVVVDRGWWQIDGGFCHGLVVSWWLGWLEWWWWCREGLWVEEREEREKTKIKMNSEKKITNRCLWIYIILLC